MSRKASERLTSVVRRKATKRALRPHIAANSAFLICGQRAGEKLESEARAIV